VSGPRVARHRAWRDRGFVTVWTVALAAACWSLVGLVFDGGRALRERSDAYGAAAAAARAGVQELDEDAVVEGRVVIQPAAAQQAALAHLASRGHAGSVTIEGLDVTVTVTGRTDFRVLPGSSGYEVSASARAVRGTGLP
jgi:Flp pilus assembly protein TadG